MSSSGLLLLDQATQIDDDEVLDDDANGNSGVIDGDYILILTNMVTGCTSDPIDVTIDPDQPTLGAGVSALTANAVCDSTANDPANPNATGAITFTPTGGTGSGNFSFALETAGGTAIDNAGGTTNYEDVAFTNSGVTTTTVTGLHNGNYIMTITDETSGCEIDHPFTIGLSTTDPSALTADIATVDNTSCVDGNNTGTATVEIGDISDGAAYNLSDYEFFWATAADQATQIDDDEVLDDDANGNSGVIDGDYILILTNMVTGCTSDPIDVTIDPDQPTLGAGVSALTANAVCDSTANDPANPNATGAITFTPTGGTGSGNFSFALETAGGTAIDNAGGTTNYEDVAFTNSGVTTTTVTGLHNGNYIMTITDETSGCEIDHPFTIGLSTTDPSALTADIATVDNTSCVDGNYTGTATVEIGDISDGAAYNLSDYEFFWATAADQATQIDDDEVLDDDANGNSGVIDGDYILILTNMVTGCTSDPIDVTIDPDQPTLGAGVSALTANAVCDSTANDPANPNATGAITFTPTGGTGSGNFSFALETAGGTAIDNAGGTTNYEDVAFTNSGVTTTTVTGLHNGNYIMTITDETSGCEIDHPFTIGLSTTDPSALTADIATVDNTSCVDGNYTGTATVEIGDISDGAAYNLSDYEFFWATAADQATQIDDDEVLDDDANGNSGVIDGDYILILTNMVTGCTSDPIDVTIDPDQPTLGAGVSALTANAVCDSTANDPANPNATGAITFTPTGGTGSGNFSFALETAGGTAIDNAGGTTNYEDVAFTNSGVTTTTVTGLHNGNYIMTITDETSGCEIDHPFTIGLSTTDPSALTADIATVDNTSCVDGNYTGTATVEIGDISDGAAYNLSDYEFFWATAADQATQIDDDEVLDDDANGNSGVIDGDYILILTNMVTGCTSDPIDVTIDPDQPTLGAGVSALTANAVCDSTANDPANPNATGAITFTPTGGTGSGNFSFALETAGGTAIDNAGGTTNYEDVAFTNSGVTTTTVTGLHNGNYIMTITDETSGCEIDHPFTIGLSTTDPSALTADIATVDNTSCVDGNYTGTATVEIGDISDGAAYNLSDYEFFWATAADQATQIDDDEVLDDDANGNSGVIDGDYILILTNMVTGCTSDPIDVTIDPDQPTLGAGVSALTANAVCDSTANDPANPNATGAITFTPTGGTGSGNFSFALETAGGTAIDNAGGTTNYEDVAFTNSGVTTTTVTGLHNGNYIMTITDETSGCEIDHPFTIGLSTTDPSALTADIGTTPNTTCDPDNYTGTATVEIGDISDGTAYNLSDYEFFWATAADQATQIDDDEVLDDDANGNSGVIDGDYILILTNMVTGCTSDPINVTIGESLPTITIVTNEDQSDFGCSGTNTGQITASISGGSTGYTLSWYSGTSATGTAINTTTDADNTISDLTAGFYIVEVQNNTTLCTETEIIEVTSQSITLTPNTSSTDQTTCIPKDGTATVTSVTVGGSPVGHSPEYKYDWFLGSSQLVSIPFDNLSGTFLEGEVINVGGETASIVAYDNSGNIIASDLSGDISDDDAISGAVSSATASVNSSEDITTTGTIGANSLNNLVAGTYSVIVYDNVSGCETTRTDIVVNNATNVLPTLSFTNVTIPNSCDASGGAIEGVITGGTGPFTFRWYEGSDDFTNDVLFADSIQNNQVLDADEDGNLVNVNNTTPSLGNLISGLYTLVVQDGNGCRTQSTYDLPYNGIQTTTTLTVTNVTECPDNGVARVSLSDNVILTVDNSGTPPQTRNGTLDILETFTADGPGGGATGIISNDDGLTNVQLSISTGSLAVGDTITGDNSGAKVTITSISSDSYDPGEADDVAEYIVYLYAGNGVPSDRDASYIITNSSGTDLIFPYKYYPLTGNIENGDGTVIANNLAIDDDNSNNKVDVGEDVTFENLPSGPYTAIARENPTVAGAPPTTTFGSSDECWTTAATESLLQESFDPIIVSRSITDDSFCDSNNGSLSITVTENSDDDYLGSGFTFEWYTSGNTLVHSETISDNTNPLGNGYTETSTTPDTLGSGDYYVEITRYNSTSATDIGCSVTSATFTISESFEVHEISGVDLTGNSDCDPFNGEVEITSINDNGTPSVTFSDYTFKWYLDDQTTQIIYVPYVGLAGGTFETGDVLTFPTGSATVISDNNADALVASFTSGTINDSEAFNNGSGVSATTSLGSSINNSGSAGDNHFVGLENGTYYITIDDLAGSGCPTTLNFFEVEVEDERIIPNFNITATEQDITCDAVNYTATGQATATVTNGSTDVDDYTFNWYFDAAGTDLLDAGDDPDLVNISFSGSGASGNTANGQAGVNIVDGLPNGTYYLQIIDNTNPGIDCESALQSVTITQFNSTISVGNTVGADFNITHVDDCDPVNGGFEILDITETRPGGTSTSISGGDYAITDYTFTWYEDDKTTLIANGASFPDVAFPSAANGAAGANDIAGLPAGTYYVGIQNTDSTGCVMSSDDFVEFTIDDNRVNPNFNITATEQDITCDAVNYTATGQATATVTNGSTDVDDYTFNWYFDAAGTDLLDAGDDPDLVNISFSGSGASGNTANGQAGVNIVDGLPNGTYYLQIIDNTNPGIDCESALQSVTITQFNSTISVGNTVGADFNITHVDDCDPVNGGFEILDITETRPGGTSTSISGGDYAITDYTFTWYEDDKTTLIANGASFPDVAFPSAANGAAGANDIAGLPAGTYYVGIQNTDSTGCVMSSDDFVEFTIDDNRVNPNFNITATEQDITCDAVNYTATGQATATVTNGSTDVDDYTFNWYFDAAGTDLLDAGDDPDLVNISFSGSGASGNTANGQAGVNIVDGLPNGTYYLQIIDNTNPGIDCESALQSVTITQFNSTISVGNTVGADFNITHVDDCDPVNGGFEILDITETRPGGTSTSISGGDYAITDYTFTWYEDDKTTLIANGASFPDVAFPSAANGAAGANDIAGLPAGTYYVGIQNTDSTGCVMSSDDFVEFTIDDNRVNPNFNITATEQDITCDAVNYTATGQATATVTNGSTDVDDYTFNWYFDAAGTDLLDAGDDPDLVNISFSGSGASGNTANGQAGVNIVDGLPNGTYYLQIIDNTNPGIDCESALQSVTITQFNSTISVGNTVGADFNITHVDDCDPVNGGFEILDITETRPGGTSTSISGGDYAITDYTFTWYEDDKTTLIANGASFPDVAFPSAANGAAGANDIAGLPAGTYYVGIQNTDSTGCVMSSDDFVEFTIDDNRVNPNFNITATEQDITCDAVNYTATGQATATVTNGSTDVDDYTFNWYFDAAGTDLLDAGDDPDLVNISFSGSGASGNTANGQAGVNIVDGLPNGTYYLQIIDNTNPGIDCESALQSVTITQFNSTISVGNTVGADFNITHVDDCDPVNGGFEILDITETRPGGTSTSISGGDYAITDYTFTWYEDDKTTLIANGASFPDVAFPSAANGAAGANDIAGLPAGTYYVGIQNTDSTGCVMSSDDFVEFTIDDNRVNPNFNITATEQDITCDAVNYTATGQATATVTNGSTDVDDYTFNWYFDAAGTDLLDAGDDPDLVNISFSGSGASGNTANGQAGVNIVDGLPNGTYYLQIIDNTNPGIDCESALQSVTITQFNSTISVGNTVGADFNITHVDDCDPVNGGFEILDITETRPGGTSTSISGGDYAITDYTFTWYEDDKTTLIANGASFPDVAFPSAANGAAGANDIAGLPAGTYYVGIQNTDSTGCVMSSDDFVEFTIDDNRVNPNFNITATEQDITCDAVNYTATGQATATVTNGSTDVDDYTFNWYFDAAGTDLLDAGDDPDLVNISFSGSGASGNTANGQAGVNIVDGLPNGTYYLQIIDNTNPGIDCESALQSVTITQFNSTISVGNTVGADFNITHVDDCDPVNGGFEILDITETRPGGTSTSISGGDYAITDYTFTWYEDDKTTLIANGASFPDVAFPSAANGAAGANDIAGLPAGTYYVGIQNTDSTGCVMSSDDFVEFTIDDNRVNPNFNITATEQDITCDAVNYTATGQATATVTNGSTDVDDYTFNWYFDAAGTDLLDAGDDPDLVNISFSGSGASGNTANGQAGVNIVDGLPNGTYYLQIIDNTNPGIDCESALQSVTITQFNSTISVGNTVGADFNITHVDDCDPVNGGFEILDITETRPGGTSTSISGGDYAITDYTFTWYEDDKTTLIANGASFPDVAFPSAANGAAGANDIAGLPAGTYYVGIQNTDSTGCVMSSDDFVEFTIDDNRVNPNFNITATEQDITCDAVNYTATGQATATVTNGSTDVDDYTFNWYFDAAGTDLLDAGDDPDLVNISFSGSGASGNTANGQAGVNIVDGLPNGTYYLQIIDNTNPGIDCESALQSVTITQFNSTISVGNTVGADFNITHVDDCDPVNGGFEILDITETRPGGTSTSISGGDYAITDYTFTWYEDDKTTLIANGASFPDVAFPSAANGAAGANDIAGLPAGTYYVGIQNTDSTGCVMSSDDFVEFTIDDNRVNPNFNITATEQDITCDAVNYTATGQATATVTNGSTDVDDYTFNWYFDAAGTDLLDAGDDPDLVNISFSGSGASGNTANGQAGVNIVDGLPNGTYYLQIIDNTNPGIDCESALQSVTITQFNSTISVGNTVGADFNITHVDDCDPVNGGFEILDITETRPGGTSTSISGGDYAITDYTFTWYEDDKTTLIANGASFPDVAFPSAANGAAGANDIAGLPAGTYYVGIQNTDSTGCVMSSDDFVRFVIQDQSQQPVVVATTLVDNTMCNGTSGTTGDGSMTIQIRETSTTTSAAAAANYTIEWYRGSSAGTPASNDFIANSAGDPAGTNAGTAQISGSILTLDSLSEGDYTVKVTKNGTPYQGCERIVTFIIDTTEPTYTIDETTDVDFDDNYNCSSPNGYIEITSVQVDGDDSLYPISDYTFTWEKDGAALPGSVSVTNGLSGGTGNRIENLDAGTYSASATSSVTGCTTETDIEIVIEDLPVNPTITLDAKTASTFCDDAGNSGNGTIDVSIFEAGSPATMGDYTLTWYRGSTTTNQIFPTDGGTRGTAIANGDFTELEDLQAGTYTLVATKNDGTAPNGGCSVQRTFEIILDQAFPVMNIPTSQITHNTICNTPGNGEIVINASNITIDGVAQTELGDYNWTITASDGTNTINGNASPYSPTPSGSSFTLTGLSPDTYTITVENDSTGCAATSFAVEILDDSQTPEIGEVTVVPNANCSGGTVAQGSIEILEIDGATPSSGNYTYQWYVGNNTSGDSVSVAYPGVTDNDYIISGLVDGNYTVEITNNDATNNTGCVSTQTINVNNNPVLPIITDTEVNNNTYCDAPNGSFVLLEIEYNGTALVLADSTDSATFRANYEIVLTDVNNNIVTDTDTSTPFEIEGLEESDSPYSVIVSRISDSNCDSEPFSFNIVDNPLNPVLQIVQIEADSTCSSSATPNGTLRAVADNLSDPSSDYSFTWTNSNGDVVSTNDTLSNVFADTYSVSVEHTPSGCVTSADFELPNRSASPLIASFDTTHITTCVPSNGVFEVTQMSNGPLSEFTFAFYDADPTEGTPTPIQDGASPILSASATPSYDVAEGDYYVQATQVSTGCVSNVVQVTIEDNSVKPRVALEDFTLQGNCDPANPNGTFTVSATNGSQDTTAYSFEWRDENGNIVEANNFTVDSLAAGVYTVTVTNLATGCTREESYTMIDDYPDPLQISISSEGNSNCTDPNGQLAATVINIPDGKALSGYQFYWFNGDLTGGTVDPTQADFIGSLYTGLEAGDYTLYVVDGTDLFCTSEVLKATVRDIRDEPDFRVDIVNNMTICYPTQPNGRAAIGFTEKELFRYEFEWYLGTDTTATPIATGTSADSLAVGVYSVVATDQVTGCRGLSQFVMEDATVLPAAPSITILQHRTNCSFPDGRAIARVNGESEGYQFDWYDENDPTTIVFTGSDISELDSISYLVKATNLSTGCESPTKRITILNDIVDPEFEIATTGSICLRSEDGATNLFSGKASIIFTENNNIQAIQWNGPNGVVVEGDRSLTNAEPGNWSVTFTPNNGCEYTREFVIDASLKIYNGVSANGDGRNDYFIIDCIDYFPNNTVTIYNRDGSLVYEADQYDNIDVRFDGTSNVGRNGLKLPVGTYFYFIDKNDGSEKIQGFLELVR
ncbi:gliding motility-associated C-terminal domain-containing protein [Marinoscillum sp.]|uniref:T9SS type B sorting domain-containing protein n=2 Tax=Marinoscillum sp. TaxID=2024838 RepID=UPI003BAA4157